MLILIWRHFFRDSLPFICIQNEVFFFNVIYHVIVCLLRKISFFTSIGLFTVDWLAVPISLLSIRLLLFRAWLVYKLKFRPGLRLHLGYTSWSFGPDWGFISGTQAEVSARSEASVRVHKLKFRPGVRLQFGYTSWSFGPDLNFTSGTQAEVSARTEASPQVHKLKSPPELKTALSSDLRWKAWSNGEVAWELEWKQRILY